MKMTQAQRAAYQFLLHLPILLIVYVVVHLVGAVKFLGDDPLVGTFPYHQVSALANSVLLLALTSGVIGGGVYALSHERAEADFQLSRLLGIARVLWMILCVLTIGAGVFGLLEGRAGFELPPALDALYLLILALVLIVVLTGVKRWWGLPTVYTAGLIALIAGVIVGMIPAEFSGDQLLRVLALTLRDTLGLGWMVIALSLWTLHRFSSLTPGWVNTAAYSVGGIWAIAAYFLAVQALIPLGIAPPVPAVIGVIVLPIAAIIIASHLYLGLSNRNDARTLSPHWISFTALLILISVGGLGALASVPDITLMIAGTRLTDLTHALILFAYAAALLGVTNQVLAELRRENRRVTGLAPFWLISGGILIGSLGLAAAGVVQIYLERILSLGYLETQALIVPLYTVWVIGWIAAGLGFVFYAMGVWARRIKG